MARRGKVIVSCAVTGSIHVPTVSAYLPITPQEIAASAIGAAKAGAAIVHLHARDPDDGHPTPDPEIFAQFLPTIRHSCDAVINITTGGGHGMTLEERSAAARRRCAAPRRSRSEPAASVGGRSAALVSRRSSSRS